MANDKIFTMRQGGFGVFPKGKVSGPEAYLGPPPPETEPELVSTWVAGQPWNVTGFSISFDGGHGLSDQEMMDTEISYSDHPDSIRREMEFPALPPDVEAADAFKALSPLLKPGKDDVETPNNEDLLAGFEASLGEVIRAYAPKHAVAIGVGGGKFVAGPKLAPALKAFSSLFARSAVLNGDYPELSSAEGHGAFFISPTQDLSLTTLFDRAAFRSLMMGETLPRALTISLFEARHALDERLAGERLPAQESWAALIADPSGFILSPDRAAIGNIGAKIVEENKIAKRQANTPVGAEMVTDTMISPEEPPDDLWNPIEGAEIDDSDPSTFGL